MSSPVIRLPLIGTIVQLKYLSLVLLVVQNVCLVLSIKASRERGVGETPYITSTAVVMGEMTKFIFAAVLELTIMASERDVGYLEMLKKEFLSLEMLQLAVPGVLYTLQNNLLFVALSNLSVGVYQVSAQLKILTTALLSVLLLGRKLSVMQVVSLLVLTVGVALVQVATANHSSSVKDSKDGGSQVIGLMAVLMASALSGFAGVYLEKILKKEGKSASLFVRNMQLGLYGMVIGICTVYTNDAIAVREGGFFQGYSRKTMLAIFTHAVGGLLVAMVMKYADNILKGFATSLSIILATGLSVLFFDADIEGLFIVGTFFVLVAVWIYGTYPYKAQLAYTPVPNVAKDAPTSGV